MVLASAIIETGVDKLVRLIDSRGSISSTDVSKELGVSTTVIMEWAEFLEEEGIISIEYKFTKPYLVARKLAKKDVREKAKEFSGKRDVFIRKAEVSLGFLEREASKLNAIKSEFDKIKKDLGFDMGAVKNELGELEKYEHLKIEMDKQIENQKKNSLDKIKDITKQFLREKRKYDNIMAAIRSEEKELKREKNQSKSLEESEQFIKERIRGLKQTLSRVEKKVTKEHRDVKVSHSHLLRLSQLAENMKARVEIEKELIDSLVEKSREQEKKIKELQDKVIKKIAEKEKRLTGMKNVSKKFSALFKKKMGVLSLIEKIGKDRNELQNDLVELIKKAKSFQLKSKKVGVGTQITSLEKKFKEVDEKKAMFEKELKELSTFFK